MKNRLKKRKRIGNCKSIISGGWGKYGPYVYGGLKTKSSLSVGTSIGTRGRELYASVNKERGQARLKYNMETMSTTPRIRINKKCTARQKRSRR